jgi:hypothetical protein
MLGFSYPRRRTRTAGEHGYSENPKPFTWTKGPDKLQRIIEATKQYQAAHPKQPKQRKGQTNNKRN